MDCNRDDGERDLVSEYIKLYDKEEIFVRLRYIGDICNLQSSGTKNRATYDLFYFRSGNSILRE